MTYNVHSCIGTDRRLAPERIAEVIASVEPDIIGLQELDVGRRRTGNIDQAHVIGSILEMKYHFHAALNVAEEQYGDAILTALPASMIKAGPIPSVGEQRGALWIEVDLGSQRLQVFNTHLGLRRVDRLAQADVLIGDEWLGNERCRTHPTVLLGDFNSVPSSAPYKRFANRMTDVRSRISGRLGPSFPSRFPLLKLDHVFVSEEIEVIDASVIATPLARRASDHLPVLSTIQI